ncbi:MAG: exodeoxyribonuclease III [Oligoflexales bacterium]|nr:exodeoxyribonuclease III [Oligoflexales bacterium]
MKLVSWNVNGLRAVLKKNHFMEFFEDQAADFVCLQEVKATRDQVPLNLPNEYLVYWNSPTVKKGYSGTAIFTKHAPLSVSYGFGLEEHDQEGRVITLEYEKFYLVNVYTPNSQPELARLPYRTQEWDLSFLAHLKNLETRKPVIFCGDLNVAHQEIDLARPDANHRNAGFTKEERENFDRFIAARFVDTFREFQKEGGHYTWWSYRTAARKRNIGWRIDYFCVSESLKPYLKAAKIHPEVVGSDHCPVSLEVESCLL